MDKILGSTEGDLDKLSRLTEEDIRKIKSSEEFELLAEGRNNLVFGSNSLSFALHKKQDGYMVAGDARRYQETTDAINKIIQNYN